MEAASKADLIYHANTNQKKAGFMINQNRLQNKPEMRKKTNDEESITIAKTAQ